MTLVLTFWHGNGAWHIASPWVVFVPHMKWIGQTGTDPPSGHIKDFSKPVWPWLRTTCVTLTCEFKLTFISSLPLHCCTLYHDILQSVITTPRCIRHRRPMTNRMYYMATIKQLCQVIHHVSFFFAGCLKKSADPALNYLNYTSRKYEHGTD